MHVSRLVQGAGGERLCLATRRHWFCVVKHGWLGIVLLVVGLALLLFSGQIQSLVAGLVPHLPVSPDNDANRMGPGLPGGYGGQLITILQWGAALLTLTGAVLLGWALLRRHFTEYAITVSPKFGGRIIKVQGIFSRRTVAVPLIMVNDLVLYEPLLGRILGWGGIDIETGNEYQGDRLEYVPSPRQFYATWATLLDAETRGHRYGSQSGTYRAAHL